MSKESVFETLESYRKKDHDSKSGRVWGYVYHASEEADEVAKKVYTRFLSENALDFTVYPSMLRLENEVVSMAAAHLNGDDQVAGNFTTGGTESIILAVKTARQWARANRPEIKAPEMILPATAHAAFHKAAHYLDVKPVIVPVDRNTFKADPAAMRAAVTENTILLVASTPSYAHGVIDPVKDLADLALEKNVLMHVDACIGGWLLPYFRRLGAEVPDFDFKIPGVTSISMDLHKYAYAAKGASVVLYRDRKLRKHQMFACSDWPGYIVVNNTMQSTKSGGPLAAAWAVMHFIGDDGYLELARELKDAAEKLVEGIGSINGLRILGQPEMTLLAVASDDINLFRMADKMGEKGWYIQPQLAYAGIPQNIHLSISPSNVKWIDEFLKDLRECAEKTRGAPQSELVPMVVEAFGKVDPATINEEIFSQMMQMAGISSDSLPEGMAEINEVLNALPKQVCEKLLIQYVNDLFTQPS
jgi:glutamate/tyrosine decarboxylase-like PLP-dependent enzyme